MSDKVVNVLDASDLRIIEDMKREVSVIGHRRRQSFDIDGCAVWFSGCLIRLGFSCVFSELDDALFWSKFFKSFFREEFCGKEEK